MYLSQRYTQIAQGIQSSIPPAYRFLCPQGTKIVGEHPIGAGLSANVWEATHDNRKVVLKSYRYDISSDVAQIIARFQNEIHAYDLLHNGGVNVPLLVGVYSTEIHPFGLIYEYMHGLDVKQYLRNEPNAGRLKLLAGIARCLNLIHNLDIAHGGLRMANTLVGADGAPRIAGLGNACILTHSAAWRAGGRTSTDRLSRSHAPELALPNANDPTYPTKASDMYAFGVMAWEILTGRPPFSEMTEIAATYSMLSGNRPPQPNYIPDRLWYVIERCWHGTPSERMSAGEVVNLLEAELRHATDQCTLPRA